MSTDANIPPHVEDDVRELEALDAEIMRELLEYRPFPVGVFPDLLAEYITEASLSIGCDNSYIGMPILSGLGAAVGNSVKLRLKNTHLVHCCIWTAVIGESGTAKSPGFSTAMTFYNKIEKELMKKNYKRQVDYQAARETYADDLRKWKRKREGDRPIKPEEPLVERALTREPTVESLAPILASNPKGLLLAPNELSMWFSSMNQYKGGKGSDESQYLGMHDAFEIQIDRKNQGLNSIYVPSGMVAIAGNIQPGVLTKMLSNLHRESGLAARFLFAYPPRRPLIWTDENDVPVLLEAGVQMVFEKLREIELRQTGFDIEPKQTRLIGEPREVLKDYCNGLAMEQYELTGTEASAWGKLKGYAQRFTLLFHCINQVIKNGDVSDNVEIAAVNSAIELTEWFKHETDRIYAVLDESATDRECRRIALWIRSNHPDGITPSELLRGCRAIKPPVANAEKILHGIKSLGLGEWDTSHPKKRIFRVL